MKNRFADIVERVAASEEVFEALKDFVDSTEDNWNYITPEEFKKMDKDDLFLLDIRKPEDYEEGHIEGAKNIFWLELLERLDELPKDQRIVLICYVGHTSSQALVMLRMLEYDVMALKFGMGKSPVEGVPVAGWEDFGFKTVKGKTAARTKYKSVEPTTPGSKNHFKITYHNDKEKWVDARPGRGMPSRREHRILQRKLKKPSSQRALDRLDTALKDWKKNEEPKVLQDAVVRNEVGLDKDFAKLVNRLFVKEVKKQEGDDIDDTTKKGLDIIKDHVNRNRRDSSMKKAARLDFGVRVSRSSSADEVEAEIFRFDNMRQDMMDEMGKGIDYLDYLMIEAYKEYSDRAERRVRRGMEDLKELRNNAKQMVPSVERLMGIVAVVAKKEIDSGDFSASQMDLLNDFAGKYGKDMARDVAHIVSTCDEKMGRAEDKLSGIGAEMMVGGDMNKEAKELVRLAKSLVAGKTLRCVSPGVLEITRGHEAHSADVKVGDTFHVQREDGYRYYGALDIKGMGFRHDPGLSGRPTQPGMFTTHGIEFAVLKEQVGDISPAANSRGFWAEWEMM